MTTDATEETPADEARRSTKESNDDRKKARLSRQAQRAHEWRVQVWAQSELKIRGCNAELEILGAEMYRPYSPDFTDDDLLQHYSTMQLPK